MGKNFCRDLKHSDHDAQDMRRSYFDCHLSPGLKGIPRWLQYGLIHRNSAHSEKSNLKTTSYKS